MSSLFREEVESRGGATSLKDELASLKIERKRELTAAAPKPVGGTGLPTRRRDRGSFALRLFALFLWLIPIGLIGGVGYFAYLQYQKARPKLKVKTAPVRAMSPGEVSSILDAKGYLKSRFQAQIGAKQPGRVQEVRVEEGTPIKKGDVLAILEHNDMKAILESRKAMLSRSNFDLEESRSDLLNKRDRAQRYQRLASLGQTSDEEADQAISAWRMSEAKVRSLEASIKLQESMIRETEVSIEEMHIRAPFDGTVVAKGAEVGETIMLGGMGAASGRGSVATIADLGKMDVETDVDEDRLGRIKLGQPAEVAVAAVPDVRYKARLRRVVPLGDRARGTVKVYVEILNPDQYLFPELVATVRFLPNDQDASSLLEQSGDRALFIPASAASEQGDRMAVWVVDRTGVVRRRAFKGAREGERIRILEGLQAGEKVVVDPPGDLVEGQSIEIES